MRYKVVVYRKLLAYIVMHGLTQQEVSDKLGVSHGTLRNKLCAATPFTLDEAIRLKKLLGIPGHLEDAFERHDERRQK